MASTSISSDARSFRVLVVDDDESNRLLTREMLESRHYAVATAARVAEARQQIATEPPDIVLLDVIMPGESGIELCREIKKDPATRLIPVVLITGLTDKDSKIAGIDAGADDFLNKPVDPRELFARVNSLLKLKQFTDELENAETVLFSLALGIEARDPYTEGHCHRLSEYAANLGQALGLGSEDLIALRRGGVLHDIGKITVPDAILRKPGPLNADELQVMRRHPVTGEQICKPLHSFNRVLPIIRHHHEHWNGGGYPDGLYGEQIPLLARILQVVDAYDALTTERPYKPAWPPEKARQTLRAEAEQEWWDREILAMFLRTMET